MPGELAELLAARAGEALDLHAAYVNPQFVRVLRTIGFDRDWARTEGAYLYDADGERYLDLLGGFGMFNVGRNNPRVRDCAGRGDGRRRRTRRSSASRRCRRCSPRSSSRRAPASIGGALHEQRHRGGRGRAQARAGGDRPAARVVCVEHGFHGLTLGSLSANGEAEFTDRFGPLLPGFGRVPFGDLDALEAELRREDVAVFLVEPVQGKGVHLPPDGYLAGAQELCRRYGTLFCVDEVQTGLRPHGTAVRVRALGARARPHAGREVALGRVRPGRGAADARRRCTRRCSTRWRTPSATARPSRRTSSAWPPASRRCASSTSEGLVERVGAARRAAARADAPARRPLRGRQRGARARADVGDRVRRAELGPRRPGACSSGCSPGSSPSSSSCRSSPSTAILSQVAGHGVNVVKGLPPLVVTEEDVDWFVDRARRGGRAARRRCPGR